MTLALGFFPLPPPPSPTLALTLALVMALDPLLACRSTFRSAFRSAFHSAFRSAVRLTRAALPRSSSSESKSSRSNPPGSTFDVGDRAPLWPLSLVLVEGSSPPPVKAAATAVAARRQSP